MTAAPTIPSEEERRLLREYRLTTVPSRRSSCSPATSNASSSTTTTTINLIDQQQLLQQQPQIITATAAAVMTTLPKEANGKIINDNDGSNGTQDPIKNQTNFSPSPTFNRTKVSNVTNDGNVCHIATETDRFSHGGKSYSQSNDNHLNHSNFGHHHHKHHHKHHHHHHHRKHKVTAPSHELTPEELSRMLELSSELSFLKLVSPQSMSVDDVSNDGNDNGCDPDGKEKVIKQQKPSERDQNFIKNLLGFENSHNLSRYTNSTCINSLKMADRYQVYIFEKVDYIKKISIRRKAFRKLKKARTKSRTSVSPNNVTEPLRVA